MDLPSNLPLRLGTAIVGEFGFGSSRVCLVIVQIGGQDVVRTIKLSTCSLVVTWHDHVRNSGGDLVHPILPQVPVALVQDTHVATLRATLVGDLARRKRSVVLLRNGTVAWELGGGTVVAKGPVALARKNTRIPVVCVTDIATVPCESETVIHSFGELLVRTLGICVAHVVQHGDAERTLAASIARSLEAQYLGSGGAVRCRDLVVVGGVRLQVRNLHVVVILAALRHCNLRTWWRTVVTRGVVNMGPSLCEKIITYERV